MILPPVYLRLELLKLFCLLGYWGCWYYMAVLLAGHHRLLRLAMQAVDDPLLGSSLATVQDWLYWLDILTGYVIPFTYPNWLYTTHIT